MNVTFHTLSAIATAAVLSAKETDGATAGAYPRASLLAVGFGTSLLLHGLLDYLPHTYPIPSALDVLLSLGLFLGAIAFAKSQHRVLVSACFLGSLFPDLVDLGPAIVNRRLRWALPVLKIFPWHWRQHSGSVYDGSQGYKSLLLHSAVSGLALILLCVFRRSLFGSRGIPTVLRE